MRIFFNLFVLFVLLMGCSKNDPPKPTPTTPEEEPTKIENKGEIYTSQLVTIQLNSINKNEYEGTLANQTINILKTADNEVSFLVPSDFKEGEHIFTISSLNYKVKYTVKKTVLKSSVKETLAPLFQDFTNLQLQLSSTPQGNYTSKTIQKFKEYYSQATTQEAQMLAEFYQNNKVVFDRVFQVDFSQPQTKLFTDFSSLTEKQLLFNFGKSVLLTGLSSTTAILAVEIPIVNIAAATAAIVSWYKTYQVLGELLNRAGFSKKNFSINNILSTLERNTMNGLDFTTGVETSLPLLFSGKALDSSFSNSTNSFIQDFFESFNTLNVIINKINGVVKTINKYVFFSDLEQIDTIQLKDSKQTTEPVTQSIFDKLSFRVENSNVNLSKVAYENGKIQLKVDIVDESKVTEFETAHLSYQYQDELNTLKGSFPINVFKVKEGNLVNKTVGIYTSHLDCHTNSTDPTKISIYMIFQPNGTVKFDDERNFYVHNSCGDGLGSNGTSESCSFSTNNYTFDGENLYIHFIQEILADDGSGKAKVAITRDYKFQGVLNENSYFEGEYKTIYKNLDDADANCQKSGKGILRMYY